MNIKNKGTLHTMKQGQVATITNLTGGSNFIIKAESLGIRVGLEIKVISVQMLRGPITIQVGHTKIAIGQGMASKIGVEKIS